MKTDNPNLNYYLARPTIELILPEAYPISNGMKERHRLYSLLLMSITRHYWCDKKRGRAGEYPMNPKGYGFYENSDYIGHNIASLAIDAYGEVLDFEFNHNRIFNSSAEHAESRMVKRVYSLSQINDSWKTSIEPKPKDDYNSFEDIILYTTLESCSQCAGIMALARVKEIVYLQTDPGMYSIANILRNLTRKIDGVEKSDGKLISPMPISGYDIDFKYIEDLNSGFVEFKKALVDTPFFIPSEPGAKPDHSESVTSFLCTELAFSIYDRANTEFESLSPASLSYPSFKPTDKNGKELKEAKSNEEVIKEIKQFRNYAVKCGRRGTPHK